MAAVIGDYISDHPSHFHTMIASSGLSRQHSHDSRYRSASHSRDSPSARRPSASPRYQPAVSTASVSRQIVQDRKPTDPPEKRTATTDSASRFPTPPSSSSPSHTVANAGAQHASDRGIASQAQSATHSGSTTVVGPSTTMAPHQQQPSPASDVQPTLTTSSPNDSYLVDATSPLEPPSGQTIQVRDLAHIQSLARADMINGSGILNDAPAQQVKYEISGMPIGDIIEMVAALLTKITTTNDLQHDALQRNVAHQQQANQNGEAGSGTQMSPLSTSVLAFHGKNVPAITILSYLSRIHKYCPTTYEVFLSLLVYFDRMTERVNEMVVKNEEQRQAHPEPAPAEASKSIDVDMEDDGESDESAETDSDLADDDDDDDETPSSAKRRDSEKGPIITGADPGPNIGPATYFVVDSFNIHRLIIAGVTCASKFFSDVFYTNSRYAKVGGLPLAELNHLELQFLLLNDFRLAVPVEDLEAYATMLVEFYAREVVVPQQSRPAAAAADDA
ncbi:S-adenosylmethionine decarboxylase proenzyme [Verticillium dahliae VDG1]|nr:S-adenosylmethionine decarboxylase proenzyme [Verticillium dahliae VDG1]